jgi:hypothetical protein
MIFQLLSLCFHFIYIIITFIIIYNVSVYLIIKLFAHFELKYKVYKIKKNNDFSMIIIVFISYINIHNVKHFHRLHIGRCVTCYYSSLLDYC